MENRICPIDFYGACGENVQEFVHYWIEEMIRGPGIAGKEERTQLVFHSN